MSDGAVLIKEAATYSPALHCSTIGAGGLNFSVRDGKRWDPAAIATRYTFRTQTPKKAGMGRVADTVETRTAATTPK